MGLFMWLWRSGVCERASSANGAVRGAFDFRGGGKRHIPGTFHYGVGPACATLKQNQIAIRAFLGTLRGSLSGFSLIFCGVPCTKGAETKKLRDRWATYQVRSCASHISNFESRKYIRGMRRSHLLAMGFCLVLLCVLDEGDP